MSTLIESATPNYNFMSAIRENKKGGGIASIVNASFQCRQSSFSDFVSFEYLSTIIKGSPQIILLIIYRPPKHSPKVFLEELSEILSGICLEYDCVIISGDFNLHVDNPENSYASELLSLLDTLHLTQHLEGPTHSLGHTLDLVITKVVDISLTVRDLALSDHSCIFFDVSMSPQKSNSSVMIGRRMINDHTNVLFEQAFVSQLSSPTSNSVDDVMDNLNSRMLEIMDDKAPLKLKKLNRKQKAPWKQNPTVKLLRRECRKAERQWRKTKLPVHYIIVQFQHD